MNELTLHRQFSIIILLSFFSLSACEKKEEQRASAPNGMTDKTLPIENQSSEAVNSIAPLGLSQDSLNDYFKHANLLELLGKKISSKMMKQIETEGQSLPEFNDLISKGWKGYVVGLQSNGGISLQIVDGYLAVFGYSYRGPKSENSGGGDDDYYLNEFKFLSENTVKVLDENFNETPMMVKIYKFNENNTIQAVSYGRGVRRTLAFYDSSKVEVSKLLPSVPDAVGMEAIKKAKELLHNKVK
jgi:hypothetical protein